MSMTIMASLLSFPSILPQFLVTSEVAQLRIVKCLVFWSSKIHQVVASANSLLICLFDVSESA